MRKLTATGLRLIHEKLLLLILLGIVSFSSCFAIAQPAGASALTPEQALTEIRQDLATKNRDELYEDEAIANKNPKVETEKKYEENLKEYVKENPEKEGVIEKVKDLLTPIP